MRMKTFLLLSALAVPMLMAAQDNTGGNGEGQDPTTPAADVVELTSNTLSYTMPAGTFFPVTKDQPALLPPATPLTWLNTSYTFDDNGEVVAWTAGDFTWLEGGIAIGNDFNLTTSAKSTFGNLSLFTSNIPTPVVQEETAFFPNEEGQAEFYKGVAAGITGVTPGCALSTTYYPFNVNLYSPIEEGDAKDAFTYDEESNGFSQLWSNIGDGTATVNGFAQRVAFPGRAYILSKITFPDLNLTEGNQATISIYKAPTEGMALGKPIYQTIVKGADNAAGASASVGTLVIDSDIIVAVQDLVVPKFAPVIYGQSWVNGRQLPAENTELYAVGFGPDGSPELVSWDIPSDKEVAITVDGEEQDGTFYQSTLAMAMNVQLDVKYSFIKPFALIGDPTWTATDPVEVNLTSINNGASYRVITSEMPNVVEEDGEMVPTIKVTGANGEDLPYWLSVTLNAPDATTADALGHTPFPDPDYNTLKAAAKDGNCQYMVVTFSLVSDVKASTTVEITVPGGEKCTFNVSCTAGLTDVITPEAQIVGREYYDLSGRRLSGAPANGFFIEKVTRADGTTGATRMMR